MGTPELRVLSLGGGVQSSCLVELVVEGELPRLDAVVFADTRGEMPETYAHVDYLAGRLATVGVPLIVVSAGDLYADIIGKVGKGMQPTPPVRVRAGDGKLARVNGYTCSYDYKRRVVTAAVKRLCGARGAWKRLTVEQWIGYSTDEWSRQKTPNECRCGHLWAAHVGDACRVRADRANPGRCAAGCERFDPWLLLSYPLIDPLRMSRTDATRWLRDRELPVPPRSACWFCPNRGNAHWRSLRAQRPHLWEKAVTLDEFVRGGLNRLDGAAYLHGSGVPLAQADLRTAGERAADAGQDGLFDETDAAFDCDAGVCFT